MTTPTPCDHDKRFTGVFLLPKETNGCLACAYEKSISDLAAREGELSVERERAEKSEGEVERLLLESEAAHAHITALRDDRRKWEQHYHDERALHGLTLERIEALKQRAEAAERERDEARRDAERYRWLRDDCYVWWNDPLVSSKTQSEPVAMWLLPSADMTEAGIDAAIDAAIAAKGE